MFRLNVFLTIASSLLIAACASNVPMIVSKKSVSNYVADGVVYSLPRQLVKVSYSRIPLNSTKLASEKAKLEKAIEESEENIKKKEQEISELETLIKNIDSSAPNKAELEAKLTLDVTKLKAEKLSLSSALSDQLNKLSITTNNYALSLQSDAATGETLSISAETPTPDLTNTFHAKFNHSSSHTDSMNITTKNGLLDGAIGYSDDKTGEILVSLTGTISGLRAPGIAVMSNWGHTENIDVCIKKQTISIIQVIDPDNEKELEVLNRRLKDGCIKITITKNTFELDLDEELKIDKKPKSKDTLNEITYPGLLYRQPGTYVFNVNKLNSSEVIQTIPVTVAQGGQIGLVVLPKGNFAKNEFELAFSNGALTKSNITLPSEMLGVANTASSFVKGIFALPTELIQLKVNYNSSEKSLLELKKSMLEQKIEIEKKQMELDDVIAKQKTSN